MVTPSFNQVAFVEETIRSVVLQGYPNLEYIVVDGGSTDGSVDVIRRYAPWLSWWVSEADEGQSAAIRKGFDRATGRLIAWLNSDDRLRPGALSAAAAALEEHPRAGLIYGRSAICEADGSPSDRLLGTRFCMRDMLGGMNCVAQPSAFFSREVYRAVGGLDLTLHYVMDMDLWIRIGSRSQAVFRDEILSDFRVHPSSKTGLGSIGFLEETVQIIERAFAASSIPAEVEIRRRAILAELTLNVAFAYYGRSDSARARSSALRALRLDPAILTRPGQRREALRCLIGRGPVRALKRLFRRHPDAA